MNFCNFVVPPDGMDFVSYFALFYVFVKFVDFFFDLLIKSIDYILRKLRNLI